MACRWLFKAIFLIFFYFKFVLILSVECLDQRRVPFGCRGKDSNQDLVPHLATRRRTNNFAMPTPVPKTDTPALWPLMALSKPSSKPFHFIPTPGPIPPPPPSPWPPKWEFPDFYGLRVKTEQQIRNTFCTSVFISSQSLNSMSLCLRGGGDWREKNKWKLAWFLDWKECIGEICGSVYYS
jgi:hypothetical protein